MTHEVLPMQSLAHVMPVPDADLSPLSSRLVTGLSEANAARDIVPWTSRYCTWCS